jgi:hypothetical protein
VHAGRYPSTGKRSNALEVGNGLWALPSSFTDESANRACVIGDVMKLFYMGALVAGCLAAGPVEYAQAAAASALTPGNYLYTRNNISYTGGTCTFGENNTTARGTFYYPGPDRAGAVVHLSALSTSSGGVNYVNVEALTKTPVAGATSATTTFTRTAVGSDGSRVVLHGTIRQKISYVDSKTFVTADTWTYRSSSNASCVYVSNSVYMFTGS